MIRLYGLAVLIVCFALLIAGCSSDEAGDATSSNPIMTNEEQTEVQRSHADVSSDDAANTAAPGTNEMKELKHAAFTYSLAGSIAGKYPIEMKLTLEGSRVSGTYMYTKYKQDLRLEGTVDETNSSGDRLIISMDEFDPNGDMTGHFDGSLVFNTESSPPSLTALLGSWTNGDGTKTIPFEARPVGGYGALDPSLSAADDAWLGQWKLTDSSQIVEQQLKIQAITTQAVIFSLEASDGRHTGSITDSAVRSKDGSSAVFTGHGLTLTFTLQDSRLTIASEGDTSYYAGEGISFGGEFIRSAGIAPLQ